MEKLKCRTSKIKDPITKRIEVLEKRIADLEAQVQGQQKPVYSSEITIDGKLIRITLGTTLDTNDGVVKLKSKTTAIVN